MGEFLDKLLEIATLGMVTPKMKIVDWYCPKCGLYFQDWQIHSRGERAILGWPHEGRCPECDGPVFHPLTMKTKEEP